MVIKAFKSWQMPAGWRKVADGETFRRFKANGDTPRQEWLDSDAKHANTMAQATAKALKAVPDVRFCAPVEANEIFPIMRPEHAVELQAAGVQFNRWPATGTTDEGLAEDENIYRFITSFKTSITDIEALANVCQTLSKK